MAEGSPKLHRGASNVTGSPSSPPVASPSGVNLLRKKNKESSPFGAASKFMGAVADSVETLQKRVTTGLSFDSFAHSFSSSAKLKAKEGMATAPVGVTKSFSVALSHITAPLWSVGAKPAGVVRPISFKNADIRELGAQLDARGVDFETHYSRLVGSPELATAFIAILLRRLLSIETSGTNDPRGGSSFAEMPALLAREIQYKGEFEEHLNDESVAHDQASRLLTEVGGAWKPRGAADVPHHLHHLRHACLINALYASVCCKYLYNDEGLQHVIDALAGQLFLISYSEVGLVALVAGIKNAAYAAKYFVQLARPVSDSLEADCLLPTPFVESIMLQECTNIIALAVENFIHRNDTADIAINALTRAVVLCPQPALVSLFAIAHHTLRRVYGVDLHALALLLDAVRPFLVSPNPIGAAAMSLTCTIRHALANVNALQRSFAASIMVAGCELKTYRCQPVHVVTTPYCARSQVFTRIFRDRVDQQRGANPMYPTAIAASTDPVTGEPYHALLDDAVLYVANQVANTFQATYELAQTDEESPANAIDLRSLFSVQPANLCRVFFDLYHLLQKEPLLELEKLPPETLAKVVEAYLALMDAEKPAKAVRRFRLESPRIPVLPLLPLVTVETDEANAVVKELVDRHWRYCDHRVTEREASWLHPQKDLALSHFLEDFLRLAVCGGGGLLRRLVTSLLSMRLAFPGAVTNFRFYILPFGFNNDLASWLARSDPVYMQQVFAPLQCEELLSGDLPTSEALAAPTPESQHSLFLRRVLNDYAVNATCENHVIVYQAECQRADQSFNYIPFVANLELGIHLNMAARAEDGGFPQGSRELVSATSFSADVTGVGAGGGGGGQQHQLSRAKSSVHQLKAHLPAAMRSTVSLGSPDNVSNASFGSASPVVNAATFTPASPPGSPGPGSSSLQLTMHAFSSEELLVFGPRSETADRVLVRMHGIHGIPLATRKHLTEAGDVRDCALGEQILDWISTTYTLFDKGQTDRAAQNLLNAQLITCACVPMGRDPMYFDPSGLYLLCPREEKDSVPMCPPSTRSHVFERAAALRAGLEDPRRVAAQLPPSMRMRIAFFPMESDINYKDLTDVDHPTREVIWLKLKSCGSSEDNGAVPSPLEPALHMSIYDVDRRRPPREREAVDKFEHYKLRFGVKEHLDPSCSLVIEARPPHQSNAAYDAAAMGLFVAVDGDVFGPFTNIRVRPVVCMRQPQPQSDGRAEPAAATISVMSFTRCA